MVVYPAMVQMSHTHTASHAFNNIAHTATPVPSYVQDAN